MKTLKQLFPEQNLTTESESIQIRDVSINSKECQEGSLFVCIPGVKADRHAFIEDAIAHGAKAVIVSKDVPPTSVPLIKVSDTRKELERVCAVLYDQPQKELKVIGITGTDGKTSTATLVQKMLGIDKCGYIGTNGYSCMGFHDKTANTTPEINLLYYLLREFSNRDCEYVAMECSSEAFYRERLRTMSFDVSLYTNITSEHLNTHGTWENYLACKLKLFKQTKTDGFCLINLDDPHHQAFAQVAQGQVLSYGKDKQADLVIENYKLYPDHTDVEFSYKRETYRATSPLLGEYNVYNLASALLICICLGKQIKECLANLAGIKISGRMEIIKNNLGIHALVDYAHTPNGIRQLLTFIDQFELGRKIIVTAQPGERDTCNLPEIGEVLSAHADHIILTTEDPRTEDPAEICAKIASGFADTFTDYEIILDRAEAIKRAVALAHRGDIVMALGRGSDTTLKYKDRIVELCDITELDKALKEREKQESSL